ncbi:MAG: DUF262 domain-containing protein [Clostridiales bacterium]|nr:DUF262 domain-containing protein [Clostridiales bacterium]
MLITWNDIPQFINRDQCYHANYGLVSYVDWIHNEQAEMGLQMNPDFQRGHVWTEDQQSRYIEFVLMGGQTGRDFYFNCPKGVYDRETAKNDYVCVDGLQRTTAIEKFLDNKIKVFGQYYNEFDRKLGRVEYTISVYINELTTRKEVLRWYVQFNDGGTPHSKEEIDRVKQLIELEERR